MNYLNVRRTWKLSLFGGEAKNSHNFSHFKKCVAHMSLFVNYSG